MVSASSPTLSVIIPSFNQFEGLKRTIASLGGFKDIEIVVVDGGSDDGSAPWLLENQSSISKLRIAPDQGIYDAMNKGITLSSGQWLWFLGTGDVTTDGAIEAIIDAINTGSESDIHAFCVELAPPLEPGVPPFYKPNFSSELKWRNTLHHQGLVYRKSSIVDHMYDRRFRVLADYHLNLKLWASGATCSCHDITVARVDAGGVSRTFNKRLYAEERLMKRDVLGGGISAAIQGVWTRLKYIKKQMARI
jgi:glycosyltransferase involved in cell wall biosynthesis